MLQKRKYLLIFSNEFIVCKSGTETEGTQYNSHQQKAIMGE